jgi:signal transduction histidine kinase
MVGGRRPESRFKGEVIERSSLKREEPKMPVASRDPAELLLRDPLAGVATLVAIVAHEIQNPITYVLGSLHTLRERMETIELALDAYRRRLGPAAEDDPAIRSAESKLEQAGGAETILELVDDALEGSVRIRGLVRDLLTISRPGGRSSALVDVNEVVAATVRLVSRQLSASARLEEELDATRPVRGDPAHLGQVFLNLLTNAFAACHPPDPGSHRIGVRASDTDRGVRIEVRDTGIGIPADVGERVFEPFFTTRSSGEGTGLGLYLSRRIVEDHGGTITYRSEPGRGSVFRVDLPEWEDVSEGESSG